jgi:hypothetical protein
MAKGGVGGLILRFPFPESGLLRVPSLYVCLSLSNPEPVSYPGGQCFLDGSF